MKAREHFRATHSPEQVVSQYRQLIEKIAA